MQRYKDNARTIPCNCERVSLAKLWLPVETSAVVERESGPTAVQKSGERSIKVGRGDLKQSGEGGGGGSGLLFFSSSCFLSQPSLRNCTPVVDSLISFIRLTILGRKSSSEESAPVKSCFSSRR